MTPFEQQHREAIQALNSGDFPLAARLAQGLLQQDSQFADGWFLMGMIAAANVRVPKAIELVTQAVALAPRNAEYLAQLAKMHAMIDDHGSARDYADRAKRLQVDDALTLDTLGVVYSKLADFQSAAYLLRKAVAQAPDNPQFAYNLGSAEQFLGNEAEAARSYRKATDLNPRFYRAHWALAELHKASATMGDTPPAELGRALDFDPSGKRLASGGRDGTLRIWHVERGHELLSIPAAPSAIQAVAFSPDGERIVTTSAGEVARLWDSVPFARRNERDSR